MSPEELIKEVDDLLSRTSQIPEKRNYWLIRTQGGQLYESFRAHGFVAIEHEKISLYEVNQILAKNEHDKAASLKDLKEVSINRYPDEMPGIVAGQLYRFIVELKKNDVVIIPSASSSVISIGIVTSTVIPDVTTSELERTECSYKKRKYVKWLKDIKKIKIDPYLFKMLQAHQAVNKVTDYGDIIERSIGNFYVKEKEANMVLKVTKEEDINARQLFNLGHYLLEYAQSYFDDNKLDLSADEIEVKITLNSPGKIHFTSPSKRTLMLMAVLVLGINGGGLKVSFNGFDLDLSTDGLMKNVIDYQNNKQDREIVQKLSNSIDSLEVVPPTDALELLKQFSTNKDLPK